MLEKVFTMHLTPYNFNFTTIIGLSSSLVYLAFEPWITCVHDELAGVHNPLSCELDRISP